MAVIELAHVQLKDGITASDPDLLKNLKEVKRVIEDYSGLPTLFFEQIDDPSVIFVVGAWPSKEKHEHGFDGSPQQAVILDLIKDQMGIDWMHYMNIDQKELPIHAPVLALTKATLPKHVDRAAFDQSMQKATHGIEPAQHGAIGAWNIRKDIHEPDVRVHFGGWDSIEDASEGLANVIATAGGALNPEPTNLFFFFTKQIKLA
ncbi:hypothetical protein LTR84_003976 [Exophiala bonariae]|uniref:ABM domain-containing protein n=1 Tax=Exophiala bonariae TaxID=1690606 RepID=A0AAV9N558_9EURO|nr:hypothetical protein LTR84_003976 [Exophiala bonariae]